MAHDGTRRGLRHSLAARLLGFATILSLIVLVITAFLLTTLYRNNVERGFNERLELSIFTLVATAEFDAEGVPVSVPLLAGQWYDQFMSGWYWQVSRSADDTVLARSGSLGSESLRLPDLSEYALDPDFRRSFRTRDFAGQDIYVVEQRITAAETGDVLTYVISGPISEVEDDIADFRRILSTTLSLFALAFIGLLALSTFLALRPLNRVGRTLERIARGEASRIDDDYPTEIAPLVAQINGLISANTRTVERARTHVGNLAHALKTPLSVLRNEAGQQSGSLPQLVADQTQLMQGQVDYHLKRARAAAQSHNIIVITPVKPVVAALARTMTKIHQDRQISISTACAPELNFRGERQDLEEMLGNLLDNACKWARSKVQIDCEIRPSDPSGRAMLAIRISDDGPGLNDSEIETALERGTRLDEAVPGSGLGLSIVRDLVELYDGALWLQRSGFGGLEAELILPASTAGRV